MIGHKSKRQAFLGQVYLLLKYVFSSKDPFS
jgi:hypothetical protein